MQLLLGFLPFRNTIFLHGCRFFACYGPNGQVGGDGVAVHRDVVGIASLVVTQLQITIRSYYIAGFQNGISQIYIHKSMSKKSQTKAIDKRTIRREQMTTNNDRDVILATHSVNTVHISVKYHISLLYEVLRQSKGRCLPKSFARIASDADCKACHIKLFPSTRVPQNSSLTLSSSCCVNCFPYL